MFETQTPLLQKHRELKTDSGGPGEFRGGLGQNISVSSLGEGQWSVSGMVDRTKYPANGLQGGQDGKVGEFKVNGETAQPKSILWMDPADEVSMNPPGGGGFGAPEQRDPQSVLADVVHGYVSIAEAQERYGVAIKYVGKKDALVRLPEHYQLVQE